MAFESLTDRLAGVFKKLRGHGKLTEADIKAAMREVRMALLEADVNYKVAKDFCAKVSERAMGQEVMESLTPAQQVVKIVNEELVALMGGSEAARLNIKNKGEGDTSKYIVQLTNATGALQQEKKGISQGTVQFNYVSPGEIKLRVIEDANGNGKWDSGNVVEQRQPERSELYVNDKGEDIFVTKANWEMEIDMDMSRIFAPVTMESLIKLLDDREAQRLKKLEEERQKKLKDGKGQNNQNQGQGQNQMGGMGFGGALGGATSLRTNTFNQ